MTPATQRSPKAINTMKKLVKFWRERLGHGENKQNIAKHHKDAENKQKKSPIVFRIYRRRFDGTIALIRGNFYSRNYAHLDQF